jgi:hypothetical protein
MVWRELGKSWHDTTVDHCDVCGNLLIRRFFEFGAGGRTLRACCEEDQELLVLLERHRGEPSTPPPPALPSQQT